MSRISDWFVGRPSPGQRDEAVTDGDRYAMLSARLGDYPPDVPVHRGDPHTLSAAARAENLAHFRARDAERIATLIGWLAREGLDGSALLGGGDAARAEGARIDGWLARWVPQRSLDPVRGDAAPNPPHARWFASDRDGPDLVFSFVSDLARLNAAAITATDPLFGWTVVEAPLDAALTAAPSPGEPSDLLYHLCLVRDAYDGTPPVVLDLPLAMLALVHTRMSPLGTPVQAQFPLWLSSLRDGAAG